MKVLAKGTGTAWEREYVCTGRGGDVGGCGAKLLVSVQDLKMYGDLDFEERTAHFTCPECEAETTVKVPKSIIDHIEFVTCND